MDILELIENAKAVYAATDADIHMAEKLTEDTVAFFGRNQIGIQDFQKSTVRYVNNWIRKSSEEILELLNEAKEVSLYDYLRGK